MEKRKKILIVDDEDHNVKLLSSLIEAIGYDIETATNGHDALAMTKEAGPDLVLLDIMMPHMDGYEVCDNIKTDPQIAHIPVIMVTALTDRDSKLKGLNVGANDFLTKPVDRTELILRVKNLLKIKEYEDFMIRHNQLLEDEVRRRTFALKETLGALDEAHRKIKVSYIETILRLTLAAEFKDEDTSSHLKRISHYCKFMAKSIGQPDEFADTIFYASPMHDIGKIGIPDHILLKPSELEEHEFEIMKRHTLIGGKILRDSISDFLRVGETIAVSHHERWDGTGYPNGLREEEIPLVGRIMNIADQYDALRSKRPYKPEFDHETAYKIITRGDGRSMPGHFDPQILEAFTDVAGEFRRIFEEYRG